MGDGTKRILIVGGGASGLLVATNIARKSKAQVEVVIAEPRQILGQGVAYSTADESHLLNVPSGRMSALMDDSHSFSNWAGIDTNEFAPRKVYASYLLEIFTQSVSQNNLVKVSHLKQRVISLKRTEKGFEAGFGDQPAQGFDVVVLAVGHGKAIELEQAMQIPDSPAYIADAWQNTTSFKNGVLLGIGTGLTFIDHALSHLRRDSNNVAIGVSRNGWLPEPHLEKRAPALEVPHSVKIKPQTVVSFIKEADDWRAAQDGVRHELPDIWHSWNDELKQEFLARDLRWWNVHRHRVSPKIQSEIDREISNGRLQILKDGITSFEQKNSQLLVRLVSGKEVLADTVVNCLGYQTAGQEGLILQMIGAGILKRGPLDLGIESDFPRFEVVGGDGKLVKNLFALGPILFGERFETTAIPELREQADLVATQICGGLN